MRISSEQWRKWFGPLPGRREAHALSWMALAAGILLCAISIFRGFHGETFLGRPLGGDFVQFYVIGKILNNYAAPQIYDLELAVGMQHTVLPSMPETQMLVFGHAPYVAELFRPFALLSYRWAYVVWLAFSAMLYASSLWLIFRATRLAPAYQRTAFLLAVSWAPFLLETWIGGQISVLVVFAWALFLYCRSRRAPFLAGLSLALAVFKPTLLVFPVAMLICGRRWRTLSGFATGAAVLASLSIRMVGLDGAQAWANTLLFNAKVATGSGAVARYAKDVDVNSFLHLLVGNAWMLGTIAAAAITVVGLGLIGRAWWRSRDGGARAANEDLLWASTICFTLILSSYTPIYDSLVLAPALALIWGAIDDTRPRREAFALWLTILYIVPCITQSFAEFLHFQIFTPLLASLGFWSFQLAHGGKGTSSDRQPVEQAGNILTVQ